MRLRAFIIVSGFALWSLVSACSGPDDQVSPDEQTRIAHAYAELTLLNESARLGKLIDTTRAYELQADSVLRLYGLSKGEFEEEFRRLADDAERARVLFDLASQRIQALRALRDSSATRP